MPFKPYHPGLPSIAQAQANYASFLSDHIPILADSGDVKCVSWNVMEGDAFNGVAPLGQSTYGENDEQRQARYVRIADAVTRILQQQQPDFFTLQEIRAQIPDADDSQGLWAVIATRLQGTNYAAASYDDNVIDYSGNITIYNRHKFTLNQEQTPIAHDMPGRLPGSLGLLGAHGLVFNSITDASSRIRLCNVHADYNDNPANHETMIREFLEEGLENDTSIVIGDFNCMCDSLSAEPQITTTSLTPNGFRGGQMQGACAIDGAFAKKSLGASSQVISHHIDPTTGQVYTADELALISDADKPELQIEEESRFRPVMNLTTKPYNIFENILNDAIGIANTISVRPAMNLKNQHGVAIIFAANAIEHCQRIGLPTSSQLLNNHDGYTSRVIYLSNEQVHEHLKQHFIAAHRERMQRDRNTFFGFFSSYRRTRLTEDMNLTDIIRHAQQANNRSRKVLRNLGWLNRDGSVADTAPVAISEIANNLAEAAALDDGASHTI